MMLLGEFTAYPPLWGPFSRDVEGMCHSASPKYRTLICCRVVGFNLQKKEKGIGGRWRGRGCRPCFAVKDTSLCNVFNIFFLLFNLDLAFDSCLAALLFCYFCRVQNKGALIQANQAWGSWKQSTSFHVLCIKGTVWHFRKYSKFPIVIDSELVGLV